MEVVNYSGGNEAPRHQCRVVFLGFPRQTFGRGDVIIWAGEVPDGVYYLASGLVQQEAISPRGETFIITVFRPGAQGGSAALLSAHPAELWRFTRRLVMGVNGLLARFEYLMFDTAYYKTVLLLLYFTRRFGQHTDGVMLISVPVAHREIAAWIGTTRETASVQMEELKKRGLITTRGRQLIIPSIAALEKEGAAD